MKKIINFALAIALFLAASVFATAEEFADTNELTVALYPYVPRIEQFKTAIRTEWKKVRPNIELNFISDDPQEEWDGGYDYDPPAKADVYVFDAMFFEYFRANNMLEPINKEEIKEFDDFVPYAIAGMQADGKYYGIPQLGCADVLFYLEKDPIADVEDIDELEDTCGVCTYTSEIPPERKGLMLDMSGGTTNATLYLDIAHSIDGIYPFPLPDKNLLDTEVIGKMRKLLSMASYENGTDLNFDSSDSIKAYERAEWFSEGWGRTFVGYTESMSQMSEAKRAEIAFKVMPFSNNGNQAVFYADAIGINTTTNDRGTRELAVELANVMAATETMVASIGAEQEHSYPQYLMSVRKSVFEDLEESFPIYGDMFGLIEDNDPIMFKLTAESRDWLQATKDTIRQEAREDYFCGCDYPAVQVIYNNSSAPPICEETCADYGGWNGQWTNEYPAAQETSVCGCNTCP